MRAYVMDAFTRERFGGNQVGVVFPDKPLDDALMQAIAAEFKHSETAFVEDGDGGEFSLRYFTPAGEVGLCGHATIAAFAALYQTGRIADGSFTAFTQAGKLGVSISGGSVLMDMAAPRLNGTLSMKDAAALYEAFALDPADRPEPFEPKIVSTGLSDIMLPVKTRALLLSARQDEAAVAALSRRLGCVGVHMFAPGGIECTAYCSNFAPLYGIPEECATGTANAALTYYLSLYGLIAPGVRNSFIQGEHMGRRCSIESILLEKDGGTLIRIGGSAVMSMECSLLV